MHRFVSLLILSYCLPAIAGQSINRPNCSDPGQWQTLFDGSSLEKWELVEQGPATWWDRLLFWRDSAGEYGGWKIDDNGHLYRFRTAGDLRTKQEFSNFELQLEWKISPEGNSGIKLRVADENGEPSNTGFEMQVLDNAGHSDGSSQLTSAGALYGLYPAPEGDYVRPPGEWNAVRIVVSGQQVEFFLNGTQTVSARIHSEDWLKRMQTAPQRRRVSDNHAAYPQGHIALQDHFNDVWYRNIRICELPASAGGN